MTRRPGINMRSWGLLVTAVTRSTVDKRQIIFQRQLVYQVIETAHSCVRDSGP
jgi:hypothetical protein